MSRTGCCTEELLRQEHRKFPGALFKLLHEPKQAAVDDLFMMPECTRDPWTKRFLATYLEPLSPEPLAVLTTIASVVKADIAEVECRHASTRRHLHSRVHTHTRWSSVICLANSLPRRCDAGQGEWVSSAPRPGGGLLLRATRGARREHQCINPRGNEVAAEPSGPLCRSKSGRGVCRSRRQLLCWPRSFGY